MRILVAGDSYMPPWYFKEAFKEVEAAHDVAYLQVDAGRPFTPTTESELQLSEYQGSPAELAERIDGVEVLVVQGAAVSKEVVDVGADLKLICCARGGPVNVDVGAVTAAGLPLVNTPGKNAEAVADQTLAFLVMLARRFPRAQQFLLTGGHLKDNWQGAMFIGSDLRRNTLGLVGYGKVGHRVAVRALAFGMTVIAFDPFLDVETHREVELVESLDELLARSDFVSLHARATKENADLFDAEIFAKMKPGAFFVNTARDTLVDEGALDAALESGHLGGAALDVVRPTRARGRHRLLRHENVVMTPHIGGATRETLLQGAEMIAEEILRFACGEPLVNVVNRAAVVV